MRPAAVPIESTEGTFAQVLTDITCVLAVSDHPHARLARTLELLRKVVPYRDSALLIRAASDRPWFITVPVSNPESNDLRVRLQRLLQTVSERFDHTIGTEPCPLPDTLVDGWWSLAVPLVTVDAIIGILQVRRNSTEYSVQELRLLAVVASQFAAYARGLQFLEQAEQARAEAEQLSRSKDRFLATLSHELRTPLNVVKGWLQVMRAGPADGAAAHKGMDVIERNVSLQIRLVDQLLDAARIATGKFQVNLQPLEILPIVSATVDGVRPMAQQKGVELEYQAPSPGTWMVSGDPTRLQQVFSNLLINAVKFTPTGGHINVAVDRDGSDIVIVFRDTGVGIAAENVSKLFDQLWQGEDTLTHAEGGLGLGLSIVHHVVQVHGGTVRAESDGPGRGATFVVRLPLSADPSGEQSLDAVRS
jgi:signal transduction histidine kinase